MRVVLDECFPRRLARELLGHEACTVQQMGWSGIANGKLLSLIGGKFDAFITVDSNLAYQENLSTLPVAVVVLRAPSNKIEDIRPPFAKPALDAGYPQAGSTARRRRFPALT